MSWHYLQGQAAASWQGNCLDGAPSALLKMIPGSDKSCSIDSETEFLGGFQSGTMCELSMANHGADASMSSRAGFRAKISARQKPSEGERGLMGAGQGSGVKCHESSAKSRQTVSLSRMCQPFLLTDLSGFYQTWPKCGLMLRGNVFELPTAAAVTNAKGSMPSLLTPTANSWRAWAMRNPYSLCRQGGRVGNLQEQLMQLYQRMTTPRCQEILMRWPEGWTDSKPLAMAGFQLWLQEHSKFC